MITKLLKRRKHQIEYISSHNSPHDAQALTEREHSKYLVSLQTNHTFNKLLITALKNTNCINDP